MVEDLCEGSAVCEDTGAWKATPNPENTGALTEAAMGHSHGHRNHSHSRRSWFWLLGAFLRSHGSGQMGCVGST